MFKPFTSLGVAALMLLLPMSLSAAMIDPPPVIDPVVLVSPGTLSYNPAADSRMLHIEAPVVTMVGPFALISCPDAVCPSGVVGQVVVDLKLDNDETCALDGVGTFALHGKTQIAPNSYADPLLVGEVVEFGFVDLASGLDDEYSARVRLTGGSLLAFFPSNEIYFSIPSEDSNFANTCAVAFSGIAKGQFWPYSNEICDVDVSKIACVVPEPEIPGTDCKGGLSSMSFTYTGESCEDGSDHEQDPNKSVCDDDGAPGAPVDIVFYGKSGKSKGSAKKAAKNDAKGSKGKKGKKGKGSKGGGGTPTIIQTVTGVVIGGAVVVDAGGANKGKFSADTHIAIVASDGSGTVLQSIQMHTSCSQLIRPGDQFGSLLLDGFTSVKGGTTGTTDPSGDPQDEICVTEVPAPVPSCTEKGDKLFEITFRYEEEDCSHTSHMQDSGKVDCVDDAGLAGDPVDIVVYADGEIYLDEMGVLPGEEVVASSGGSNMKAESHFEISRNGEILQSGYFHTSCSQPLSKGDQFGALEVVGVGNLFGAGTSGGGVDVEYTITVGNPNSQDILVDVSDPILGINEIALPIPAGSEIEIVETMAVDGPITNTVYVDAVVDGSRQFCAEAEASAEITEEEPPPPGALCTNKIEGTILKYIGPFIPGPVTVEFEAKEFDLEVVSYVIPGGLNPDDVLTSPAESGMTINAPDHGKDQLGTRTRIRINGVQETIHTSCSSLYERGLPAPLDGESGTKGDPSDNWFVEDFTQKP